MSGTIRVHEEMLLAACKCTKNLFIWQVLRHLEPQIKKRTNYKIWYFLRFLFNVNSLTSFALFCFVGAAEALAAQVTQENFDKGLIYPPFSNIRKISAHIAANVAAKAYELGEP